ncbi:MAG: hypothetical protein JST67_04450 [Bacteroidetes bacterium]|nr:hypothetical protein [Bacteroidota bacterium]
MEINKIKKIIFVCLALMLLASCAYQKRLYNKGFYVSKSRGIENKKGSNDSLFLVKKPIEKTITASSKKGAYPFFNPYKNLFNGCDTIYLRSGGRVYAKVTEVNLSKILFKKCGEENEDKVLFLKKEEISQIVYANGMKESYTGATNNTVDKNQPQNLPGQPPQNYYNNAPDFYGNQPPNPNQNQYQPPRPNQNPYYNPYQDPYSHKYNQPYVVKERANPLAKTGFILSSIAMLIFLMILYIIGLVSFYSHQSFIQALTISSTALPLLIIPISYVIAAMILCIIAIVQLNRKEVGNRRGIKLAYIGLAFCLAILLALILLMF